MLFEPRFRITSPTEKLYGFDHNQPCVWVVYEAGCAGDLWGAIIGHHYPRTGNHFLGIDKTGRVILDTIDSKWLNLELLKTKQSKVELDTNFINTVNQGYSSQNFPFSMSGQCLLVNHLCYDECVKEIVDRFPLSKVIRIMPNDNYELKIAVWMSSWKNNNVLLDFETIQVEYSNKTHFKHDRVLDISFGNLWSQEKFEKTYDSILGHLGLPYKLVRYDFIKFWFDCQHNNIKPHLLKLFE